MVPAVLSEIRISHILQFCVCFVAVDQQIMPIGLRVRCFLMLLACCHFTHSSHWKLVSETLLISWCTKTYSLSEMLWCRI